MVIRYVIYYDIMYYLFIVYVMLIKIDFRIVLGGGDDDDGMLLYSC